MTGFWYQKSVTVSQALSETLTLTFCHFHQDSTVVLNSAMVEIVDNTKCSPPIMVIIVDL